MQLDFLTLTTIMAANLFMISASLPLIMGTGISPSARAMQHSLLLQAIAWSAIIASGALPGTPWDQALSTLSIALQALAQGMLYRALQGWLGPRPLRRTLLVLIVATPLGYTLGFDHYAWRVGWSNLGLALLLLIVARAALYPVVDSDARWRYLLLGCLLSSALFTLARGFLGAFTDQYPSFRTPHPVNLLAGIATNVSLVLGTMALLVAWRSEAEHKLRALAMTDGLTGLLNRRGFTSQGEKLLVHARRHHLPLTALMLDLDHFKHINDTHGHETGDRALRLFSRLLAETCRSGDVAGRLGGEEFCVLMLNESTRAGEAFDHRLRKRLAAASPAELGFALNASGGMATLRDTDASLAALLARADAALYDAKARGRAQSSMAP